MKVFRLLALVLVAWLGLAAGPTTAAFAQNGLERFEKDVKPQFEFEKFTYESGQAVGNSGFVLNKVIAVVPANAATGELTEIPASISTSHVAYVSRKRRPARR